MRIVHLHGCPLWCSMYQYSYRKLDVAYNDAFRHLLHEPRWCSASQILWPIMCLRLPPIFVAWCILCGDPWMLRTVFLLMMHYVLIYLLETKNDLFLDGGATFCFIVFYFVLLMRFFFHCILLHGLWACYWMWMKWNEWNEMTRRASFWLTAHVDRPYSK